MAVEAYTQGTDLNDRISFSDISTGYDGHDLIDTVVFSQNRSETSYHLIPAGAVIDATGGRQNIELLHTERLEFADGTLAVDVDGVAGAIYRAYSLLDRAPSTAEMAFWTDWQMSNVSAVHYFNSAFMFTFIHAKTGSQTVSEFESKYDFNNPDPSSIRTAVDELYQAVLGRPGDAAGLDFWSSAYNHTMTEIDIVRGITESAEAIGRTSAALSHGIWLG